MLRFIGRRLAHFLAKPREGQASSATVGIDQLTATLQMGDVLLVEGSSRFSEAIKYLTQSTWSHAALYAGNALDPSASGDDAHMLLEADVTEGVRAVPLSYYADIHTRICRPVGLSPEAVDAVIGFMLERLGHEYDVKNIIDLARYLIQKPPVPGRYRRRLVALGSGDPTRAICSSLIAQAFQSVRYPVLPHVETADGSRRSQDILHIRHHSLFVPRDFDISPYFRIVKASIEQGFDYRALSWSEHSTPPPAMARDHARRGE